MGAGAKIMDDLNRVKLEGELRDNSFFMIIDKNSLEKIDNITGICSGLRRFVCKTRTHIHHSARFIISSDIFEGFSLLVIIANSALLAMEDPTQDEQPEIFKKIDDVFLILYTIEMVLKILGMGFLLNKGAYLKDYWNILDFTIVMTGYLTIIMQGGGIKLSVLRSFRVLRPLKTISGIEGLRVIV